MYKTLEAAVPMLQAYNIITGGDRTLQESDLETFGREFFNTFLHTDYMVKHRRKIRMVSSDVPIHSMIGKWAYSQEVAMQIGAEAAFGKIMGVRNTHSWMGIKYFISNNVSASMREMDNASIYLMPFDMPSQFELTPNEQTICCEYLHTHCIYLKDGLIKKGEVYSFNDKEIFIHADTGEKDSVLFENRHTEILEHSDAIEHLTMAITMIRN